MPEKKIKQMDIWIVNPFDNLSGEDVKPGRYMTLAETLAQRGHKVLWWSSNFDHRTKTTREKSSTGSPYIKTIRLKTPAYSRNISLKRLYNHVIYATKFYNHANMMLSSGILSTPDLIIVSMPPILSAKKALDLGDKFNTKVIIDIQDAWPETFYRVIPGNGIIQDRLAKLFFSPLRWLAQRNYSRADAITAVAKYYADLSGAKKLNIPNHVTYIGAPVKKLRSLMDTYPRTEKSPTFTYLGSISSNYDLETLLKASQILKHREFDFKVKIAGAGDDEARLKKLAEKLNLKGTVQFCGFLDFKGMAKLMKNSDVAINPIKPISHIAMPNKVGDYFAADLAIINSIKGELSELLEKSNSGLYYEAENITSLSLAMKNYLKNPEKLLKHKTNSSRIGKKYFDRGITYEKLILFLERQVHE